jgi:glycosyltransferase involved in cell wall biosynthesis
MNHDLISVIIPVYNGERYLAEAVESIRQQNYEPLEIIIVDDGSTDDTAKVAMDLGKDINYFYQENRGPAAARNTGIKTAKGTIIGFLDADDLWPVNKLRIQILRFVNDPLLQVIMGRAQFIKMPGAPEIDIQFEGPDNTLANIHLGCGLFRKPVFDMVGLFDESLRYCEDHDWFLRARELNIYISILKEVTLYYRIHDQNMSHKRDMGDRYLVLALKKSLDRRRKKNTGHIQTLPGWFAFDEARISEKI